jgi:hypothetical protein
VLRDDYAEMPRLRSPDPGNQMPKLLLEMEAQAPLLLLRQAGHPAAPGSPHLPRVLPQTPQEARLYPSFLNSQGGKSGWRGAGRGYQLTPASSHRLGPGFRSNHLPRSEHHAKYRQGGRLVVFRPSGLLW